MSAGFYRLWAALNAGLIAFMAARYAGLPVWRDYPIGDAFDFGLCSFIFVSSFIKALRNERP